jgi:hypothetical protein
MLSLAGGLWRSKVDAASFDNAHRQRGRGFRPARQVRYYTFFNI